MKYALIHVITDYYHTIEDVEILGVFNSKDEAWEAETKVFGFSKKLFVKEIPDCV